MNPPYNNIFRKVESAFVNYLTLTLTPTELNGASLHLGIAADTVDVPYIYCHCPEGQEDEPMTGNWHVEPEVVVVVNASDETALANAERFGAVVDALWVTNLKDFLMGAEYELSVFGVKSAMTESGISGNHWIGKIKVPMMVCGSAL